MSIIIKLKSDISQLRKSLELDNPSIFVPVYEAWGAIYRSEMMQRFSRLSRGGGEWPPLAESTIARRRKGKKGSKRKVSILIDSGTLFNTLSPVVGAPGQLQEILKNGVRVGIGGNSLHPGGPLTIGRLALYHQEGGGHLPQRKIIVDPSERTINLMGQVLVKGIQDSCRD